MFMHLRSQRFSSGIHSPLQLETQRKGSLKASKQCQLNSDVSLTLVTALECNMVTLGLTSISEFCQLGYYKDCLTKTGILTNDPS